MRKSLTSIERLLCQSNTDKDVEGCKTSRKSPAILTLDDTEVTTEDLSSISQKHCLTKSTKIKAYYSAIIDSKVRALKKGTQLFLQGLVETRCVSHVQDSSLYNDRKSVY